MTSAKKLKTINTYTFFGLFFILILLAFIMLSKFLLVILSALIVVYIFHPLHLRLQKRIKNRNITSLFMTILVLLVISLPFVIFVSVVAPEVNEFYQSTLAQFEGEGIFNSFEGCQDGVICGLHSSMNMMFGSEQVESVIKDTLYSVKSYIFSISSAIVFSIPKMILQGFLLLFVIFFAFKDGESAIKIGFEILPLSNRVKVKLIKQTRDVIFATLYGNIVIAFIQGGVAMVGFYIFGLQSPVFWGLVTVLAALVPFVGTAMIWLPAGIGKIIIATMSNDGTGVWMGIGLLIYGALLIGTVDNFLKPKLIGDRARVHPLFIFIGLIGGISVFGLVGVIIGPLTFALLAMFIRLYRGERHEIIC